MTSIERPSKEPPHRIKEMSGLVGCPRPTVAAGDNVRALDGGCRFVSGLREHTVHDVFALTPRCKG